MSIEPGDRSTDSRRRATGGPASLWRHGDFRKLWAGQTISLIGTRITFLALPLAAILGFKAHPFQVGLLTTLQFVPYVLFGLPIGAWVDRLPRRPILIIADLARFVAMASIPLAAAFGALRLEQLYVVAFVSGFFEVLFEVAYLSYLPSLVDHSQLLDANGKLEASRTAAGIAGPGLGGLLVQAFTAAGAIAADAASYLASVASLMLIKTREPAPERRARASRGTMRADIADGLRYVLGHPLIRPATLCTSLLNLFGTMGEAVLLIYAVRTLGLTAGGIGGILALANVGVLAGAMVSPRLARRLGIGRTLLLACPLIAAGSALVPLASRSTRIPLLIGFALIVGFGGVVFDITVVSLRQTIAPHGIQGRTNATVRFVAYGTIPLGAFLGGVLGNAIHLRPTLWIGAIGLTTATLPILFSPVRRLRSTPEPEAAQGSPSDALPLSPDVRAPPLE